MASPASSPCTSPSPRCSGAARRRWSRRLPEVRRREPATAPPGLLFQPRRPRAERAAISARRATPASLLSGASPCPTPRGSPRPEVPDASAVPRLRGRRLVLARVAWGALVAPALALFLAAVPAVYLHLSAPPEAVRASLARRGLSVGAYAAYL